MMEESLGHYAVLPGFDVQQAAWKRWIGSEYGRYLFGGFAQLSRAEITMSSSSPLLTTPPSCSYD